jgi:hypothetical protein
MFYSCNLANHGYDIILSVVVFSTCRPAQQRHGQGGWRSFMRGYRPRNPRKVLLFIHIQRQ